MNAVSSHLQAFSALLAADSDARNLHTRDLQLLALIVSEATPISVGQAATSLGIASSHCSRVADKLVQRGLIVRSEKHSDRRIMQLAPSKTGRMLDARVRDHFRASTPT
jgi:DNA-binding MarR family transcriptional regulator